MEQKNAHDISWLEQYYAAYDEEGRLASRHGQVEYQTTLRYLHRYLEPGARLLEIGAGTGRYSLALAREGYRVDAVELVQHNIEKLRAKLQQGDRLTIRQGDALDLSAYPSNAHDGVLLLGPMYHLYTRPQQVRALSEAVRVAKPGGHLFVAYCMNEATVICYAFRQGHLRECLENGMFTEDFHCVSTPKDLFQLMRTEEIDSLNAEQPVRRLALVAADGATNYMRETVDGMDDETFGQYLRYHYAICERADLVGASHHTLDILQKQA